MPWSGGWRRLSRLMPGADALRRFSSLSALCLSAGLHRLAVRCTSRSLSASSIDRLCAISSHVRLMLCCWVVALSCGCLITLLQLTSPAPWLAGALLACCHPPTSTTPTATHLPLLHAARCVAARLENIKYKTINTIDNRCSASRALIFFFSLEPRVRSRTGGPRAQESTETVATTGYGQTDRGRNFHFEKTLCMYGVTVT
jgi:hypothetical protein